MREEQTKELLNRGGAYLFFPPPPSFHSPLPSDPPNYSPLKPLPPFFPPQKSNSFKTPRVQIMSNSQRGMDGRQEQAT